MNPLQPLIDYLIAVAIIIMVAAFCYATAVPVWPS